MLKFLSRLLLIAALCVPWATQAQSLIDYTLTVDTTTFTSIASVGTNVIGNLSSEDDGYTTVTLPFTFPLGEDVIPSGTSIALSSNGFIRIGATSTSGTTGTYSGSYRECTAIMQADAHMGRNSGAGLYYYYNTADSTFTIEYHLLGRYSTPYGSYSYQYVFHQNGDFEFIYDFVDLDGGTPTMATYLVNNTTDRIFLTGSWDNPTVSSAYASRTSGTTPASGLRYYLTRPFISCPKPLTLDAFVGTDEITLYWTPGDVESAWEVVLGTDTIPVNDTFYTFSNLTPNTQYAAAVRAICGTDDISTFRTGSFRTLCTFLDTMPYIMDFEGVSTGGSSSATFVPCLTRLNNGSTYYGYPYVGGSSYNHTSGGSQGLYWYNTTTIGTYGDYQYVIMPGIDTDAIAINTLQVTFWSRPSATSYSPVFHVGVMTDPLDPASFQSVDTIHVQNITTWQEFTTTFNNFTGNGAFIAIRALRPSSSWYAYVDDIMIETIPTCFKPYDVTVNAAVADSVVINWTGFANSVGYDVAIVHSGQPISEDNISSVSNTEAIIDSLQGGVSYDVYIRSDCGSETSLWSNVVSFTPGEYLMPVSGTNTLYTCGAVIYDDGGSNGEYSASCNSTLYVYPGDNTAALSISGVSYTESSFDYLRIYEGIGTSGTVLFDDYGVSATQTFGPFEVAGPITITFHSDGSVFYDGFQINVTCLSQPDCPRPDDFAIESLLADSVEFSWSDPNGSLWAIEYGPTGFTRGDENDTSIHWADFTDEGGWIEELNPGTVYDFYLMSLCSNGDTSWARLITLQTPCYPIDTLPWHYGFEDATSGTSGSLNPCWLKKAVGVSSYYPYVSTSYHAEGTKSLYFYGYSSTYYCYAVMPPFQENVRDLVLDFKLLKTSDSYGSIEVGVMTNPLDINTFTTVDVKQPTATSVWESFRVNLGNYTGNGRFIAFRQASTNYTYLDDITVSLRVPCPEPVNVRVQAVSTSSAYVTWDYASGYDVVPDDYEVVLVDNVTQTETSLGVTQDNYIVLTGLTANNAYTVRVTTNCGDDVSSSDSVSFTTNDFGCMAYDNTGTGTPVQVGDGTGTSYYLPIGNFYNYSYTQQLYEPSELGAVPMPITGISFEYGYSSPSSKSNVSIYLANTTASSLASSFVPYDASTFKLVYTGNMNATNGWNQYQFDSVFYYDGTSNLLVVVHDNTGSYSGSSYVFKTHPVTGKGRYINNDSSPYSITSPGTGTALAYRANTKFHTYACATAGTCAAPLVAATDVSPTSVDLLWAPGGSETSWTVEHKVASDATWTTDFASTSLMQYSYTNLLPSTEYQFRVSHACDTTTLATVYTVKTPCVPISAPLFEDFSSWSTGSSSPAAPCWHMQTTYTSSNYPYITTGTSMGTDNKSLYFYAPSGANTWFVLPKFDVPVDTLLLSFFTYYSSTTYSPLRVGVMTNPEDFSTFQQVGTAAQTTESQWVGHEYSFQGMPDGYIALAGPAGTYTYFYVDNIEVNYFNPCVRPTNVNATNVTQTSANISWTDDASTDFIVEYGPTGFAQGSGTVINVTGTSTQLTGLVHSSMYDVYVRGLCGAGDTSNWSFVYSFATSCGTINALPFTETFNSWGTGSSVHAPNCWAYGSTYSSSYPYIYSSYNHSGSGGSMYMYNYSTNYTYFSLPEFDSSMFSASDLQVYFYAYNPSSTATYVADVIVGVCSTAGDMNTFVGVDTITLVYEGANAWRPYEVALDSYTGNGRYITFVAMPSAGSTYCYPVIDDITLELIPTCQRPNELTASNATSNSVDLAWNDRANASQWQIEYGPMGFTPGTGTTVIANSNPFTLNNLPASYQGEFYVRAICSATDSGEYSREGCAFNTTQAPATLPYHYDFESAAEWANWQHSTNNTSYDWYRGSAANTNGNTSQYSMYVSADQGVSYRPYPNDAVVNAAVYRDVDFGPTQSSFTVTFDARVGGTIPARYDALMVFLVDPDVPTVPSNSGITSPWGNVNDLYRIATVYLDTNWTTYTASFDTVSGVKRVAFFWFNQNTGASYEFWPEAAAVDNIHIVESDCPRPVATTLDAVTSTTATLSWTGPSSANYQVIYRPYPGSASQNVFVQTPTNSITLTGLDPMSEYVVWVRKLCTDDTSLTSDAFFFTTEMCDGATWYMNYDASLTASTSTYSPIGYSFYNYGYVQNIVDSAYLAGLDGDINAIAFEPTVTTAGDEYENMTVYLANVPEDNLANGWILPDNTDHIFQKVIDNASFSYTATGIQLHGFDTVFTWDGHSNILVSVVRNNGSYTTGATFAAHNHSVAKSRYVYRDSPGGYNYLNPESEGTALTTAGDLYLISCGAGCRAPSAVNFSNTTYNSTIASWVGNAADYEVAYKAANETTWPEATAVTGNTFTLSNLAPTTTYTFRVRAICDATEELISDWGMGTFTTDSLPCFAPSNVEVDAQGQQAIVSWTAGGNETQWVVRVYNTTFDQEYTATTNPYTVTGLTANVTYNVTVSSLCGNGAVQSEWTEPVSFTTVPCDPVTNIQVTGITTTTANVSWTAGDNNTGTWKVDWNYHGASVGSSGSVTVNTTSAQLTGLTAGAEYDVSVSAICAAGYESNYTTQTFTTTVGIASVEEGMNLSIYPNPATGNTTITLSGVNGNVTLSVIDMSGRTVKTTTMECSGDCQQVIDVDNLAAGAYFVRVYGDNVNTVKKLIVK